MMPRTLYAKLAAGLVVVLLSIGVVYTLISFSAVRHYLAEVHQTLHRDLARNLVADRNLVAQGRLDQAELEQTFHEYMTINPSIEIYLLDLEGRIISFSADPGKVKRRQVSLAPVRAFLGGDDAFPVLGDDPRSHDRRKAFSVTPVPTESAPEGYLYVVLRGEQYDSVDQLIEDSWFIRLSGAAVVGALGFGLLAGLALFHLLTRRLHRLTALMERFRASDFARHESYLAGEPSPGADEVDRLGATFDQMAGRIRSQFEALADQDRMRRDLVAKVSHDLRTPLASLHGYLETLQIKADRLDERAREEYLDIALRHSDRLTRLVAELFELAKLEAEERAPETEPFAPAELVQDVAQKFSLTAAQSGLSLRIQAEPDLPLVDGDIAMIERVLENLIGNALEHTPHGGAIVLPVQRVGDEVGIAVVDNGAGIAPEDLAHVLEPYYRKAAPDSAGKGHAGLGLAIASRIVELHGRRLTVASRLGEGTRFDFTLPARREPGGG